MIEIHNDDCMRFMDSMGDNSVDLILTSPPYNTGRISSSQKWRDAYQGKYDIHVDAMSQDDYIEWTVALFDKFDRVLSDDGVILYNLSYGSDTTMNKEAVGLMWLVVADIIRKTRFTVVDRIIWKKKSALPNNTSPNKLTRIVEDIFVIVRKSEVKTFRANKRLASVRKDRPTQAYYENVFNLVEAKNNDGPCPYNKATFSTELCEKLLGMYAEKGTVVFDPFIGSGTTAVACKRLGLDCIGCEISDKQVQYAKERLSKEWDYVSLFNYNTREFSDGGTAT